MARLRVPDMPMQREYLHQASDQHVRGPAPPELVLSNVRLSPSHEQVRTPMVGWEAGVKIVVCPSGIFINEQRARHTRALYSTRQGQPPHYLPSKG